MPSSVPAKAIELLRRPGRKPAIRGVATSKMAPPNSDTPDEEKLVDGFAEPIKTKRLDRWLDCVVAFAGSSIAFVAIMSAVLCWCLMGIKYGHNENWQVVISDAQALLCYVYDSFLVRQELNDYTRNMIAIAQLQSRSQSHLRMLVAYKAMRPRIFDSADKSAIVMPDAVHGSLNGGNLEDDMPGKSRLGRVITAAAMLLGHVVTLALFWLAIIVWISIGPLRNFDNEWQLYMNSASSALMVVSFALLANIGQRQAVQTRDKFDVLFKSDATLELYLRSLTHDVEPNVEVILEAPQFGKAQRAIFYYADFVGTLVGICILITVICIWVAIGPALDYSSNWWLLIGTYAGLVGMFDGFVLRNMQARLRLYGLHELEAVHIHDRVICDTIGIPYSPAIGATDFHQSGHSVLSRTSLRISLLIDRITSHELAVGASLATVIGLLIGSTAMHWTLTGQLLSNVPPSIIESWLMLTLIMGHNMREQGKALELQTLHDRRHKLLSHLMMLETEVGGSGAARVT